MTSKEKWHAVGSPYAWHRQTLSEQIKNLQVADEWYEKQKWNDAEHKVSDDLWQKLQEKNSKNIMALQKSTRNWKRKTQDDLLMFLECSRHLRPPRAPVCSRRPPRRLLKLKLRKKTKGGHRWGDAASRSCWNASRSEAVWNSLLSWYASCN